MVLRHFQTSLGHYDQKEEDSDYEKVLPEEENDKNSEEIL